MSYLVFCCKLFIRFSGLMTSAGDKRAIFLLIKYKVSSCKSGKNIQKKSMGQNVQFRILNSLIMWFLFGEVSSSTLCLG